MPKRVEERVRPITPQLAWRVAVLGGIAFVLFGIVFFRLWYLQVLTGQEAVTQARDNRVRKVRIEAPRGDIVDKNNVKLVRTKAAAVVQMVPSQLPESVREDADTYRENLAAAENDRLKAQDSYDALRRQLKDDGRKDTKAEKRELSALRKQARAARPVQVPTVRLAETDLIALYKRMGKVLRISPKTIHKRVIRGIADAPYSNVTIVTDVERAKFNYMRENADQFKGVVVEERYLRRYPREAARRADLRARVRDRPGAAQEGRRTRASPRARGSARAASRSTTTSTCAAPTATSASWSTRSGAATTSASLRCASPSRASG